MNTRQTQPLNTKPQNRLLDTAKRAALGLGLCATISISTVATAGDRHRSTRHGSYLDHARVVHVQPVYRKVAHQRPVRECRATGHRRQHSHRTHGPRPEAVIGGLIGGAIGNHIGRKSGNRHTTAGATVFGAVVGSVIGNESRPRRHGHGGHGHRPHRPGKTCTTHTQTYYESELSHYLISYVWHGHRNTVQRKQHPGNYIEIDTRLHTNHRPNHHRPHRPNRPHRGHGNGHNHWNAQVHEGQNHQGHRPHNRPHHRPSGKPNKRPGHYQNHREVGKWAHRS